LRFGVIDDTLSTTAIRWADARRGGTVDPFDTLQTLSQIGIAVTGFAGVVAALDTRRREEWSDLDRGNLYTLLVWSVAVVFLAQLPGVLHGLGGFVPQPWRASHAVFATYHSWVYYGAFRTGHAVPNSWWRDRPSLILAGIGFLVLALEIASALGLAGDLVSSFYIIAVLWFLFLAVTRFVVLVADLLAPRGAS
jgi:hypothetical protein